MSQKIPAWKKLGLKVKNSVENDPLAIAAHIGSADTESIVKENAKKRKLESENNSETPKSAKEIKNRKKGKDNDRTQKAPKRQKLPKDQRKPPPEKDQLHYLKQFNEDKDNWKFSKQKQNWIIKNIRDIPDDYEDYLFNYLKTIQGGSKDRLIQDLKSVIESWNKLAEEAEKILKERLNEDEHENESRRRNRLNEAENEENEDKDGKDGKNKKNAKNEKPKKKEQLKKESPPDYDYAVRARELYLLLADEKLLLHSIDGAGGDKEKDKDEEEEEKEEEEDGETKEDKEPKLENNGQGIRIIHEDVEVTDYVE